VEKMWITVDKEWFMGVRARVDRAFYLLIREGRGR
jgi:hypothetical protein